jgi:hypothetical protein
LNIPDSLWHLGDFPSLLYSSQSLRTLRISVHPGIFVSFQAIDRFLRDMQLQDQTDRIANFRTLDIFGFRPPVHVWTEEMTTMLRAWGELGYPLTCSIVFSQEPPQSIRPIDLFPLVLE